MWRWPVLGRGFRPFFLAAGIYGAGFLGVWLAVLDGRLVPPRWLSPIAWHAHEMLFGFVAAAVAGFLLTSVPVWTGRPAVTGARLAGLVALWLAGRAVMAAAGTLPAGVVAAVDLAFLPTLALAIGRPLVAARNRRNFGFPLVLLALSGANAAVHASALGGGPAAADVGLRLGVYGVVLLIVVIGGRIVPAFTANALRTAGRGPGLRTRPWADRLGVPALLLFVALDLAGAPGALRGAAALAAAAVLAARMAGWRTLATRNDPLLWSLHLGYAWVPAGLALEGLAALGVGLPRSVALHALTAGAMGTMILAVMSRVPLGHTGRPLVAPSPMVASYGLVTAAALLRVAGPLLAPGHAVASIEGAGILWSAAFAVYVAVYAPILVAPRVDGRPG